MNRTLHLTAINFIYSTAKSKLILFVFLISSSWSFAQTVTVADATGEAATITGGQTNVAVLGFNLTRGTAVSVTGVTVTFSAPIAGVFTNVRLFESADATFTIGGDGPAVGTMALASGNDYTLTFAGRPIAAGGTFYYIVADVSPAIQTSVTINATCSATQIITTDAETGSATGPTYNNTNITELRADFTQNTLASTALGNQSDVALLDFDVVSNGTQNITAPLVFTFDVDVTNILENWDLQVDGLNITGTELYALTGGGTILTITGFANVNVASAKNFELYATIQGEVQSSDDFTISLASSGVSVDVGYPESFTTFINSIDVTALEADFTQNTDDGTAVPDQNGVELLDFTVLSNGTQNITPALVFTFNTDVTNILENWDLQVDGFDIPGTENYSLDGTGTILTITAFNTIDISTSKNFKLFADIKAGASATDDFTITLAEGGVTVTPGLTETFGTFTNSVDISVSQASDITLTGGTTSSISYRSYQGNTIGPGQPTPPNAASSVSLADFLIRDGGATAPDADNKSTTVTSIEIEITNIENLRAIALFDDGTDTEIAGTELDVSTLTGTVSLIFTPSTPIVVSDNGTFQINLRASFRSLVTDKESIQVSIIAATAANTGSGFSAVGTWASTQTASNTNLINVAASKFLITFSPSTQTINSPIIITVQAVDQTGFQNRDLDYTGKVDLLRDPTTGTFTATQPFIGRALVAGQFQWTNVQFSASNTYTIEVSDEDYLDAPDNQSNINDASSNIIITATSSTITLGFIPSGPHPGTTLCFGGSFQTLSNIVIAETDASGFSSSGSFSLALPTGFIFDTGTNPTLTMSNSTTSFTAVGFTGDNIVQFTYNITSPTGLNTLTIANLRIRYPDSTAPSGGIQITRSGGTAVIAGVGAGTHLGTVNAALGTPPGTLGFTVQALTGDVAVSPTQTNFSINGNAVQLVGSPSGGVFSGSGVTFVSGSYRFNPASLSSGTYPITYTYTNAGGQNCQFTFSKDFVVYSAGIDNLGPVYCTNDDPTPNLTVDPVVLNQIGPNLKVSRFVYFNFNLLQWINITSPSSDPTNTKFNPALDEYQAIYNQGPAYGYPVGIIIGFYVASTITNIELPFVVRQQTVEVRPAPSVNFSTSSNTYTFCEDDATVTLIGSPANSTNTTIDRFDANGNGLLAINNSVVSGNVVWTFTPAAVTPVGPTTPQTFTVTYKYTDPVTSCDATTSRSFKVKDRPESVVNTAISQLPIAVSPPNNTRIELCQGSTVPQFSAPDLGNPLNAYYTWYEDNTLLVSRGTGSTFTPPIDNTVAAANDFYVTQTTQKEAIIFFGTELILFRGCESDKGSSPSPLRLDVVVNASPPPPTIADPTLDYCVGQSIPNLSVTGSAVKWYTGAGSPIITSNSPTAAQLGIDNSQPGNYQFYVTQTLNGCESTIPASATFVTVAIKPLPIVSIVSDNINPLRICKTDPPITFRAFDGITPAIQPPGTISWTGVSAIVPDPGNGIATLNPSVASLVPGDYTLTVNFTASGTNCSNTANLPLKVLPTVNPSLAIGIACDSLAVSINNTSSMVPIGTSSTISKISWQFGDGAFVVAGADDSYELPIPANINGGRTTGTYDHPQHIFSGAGPSSISYEITTSDGCIIKPPAENFTVNPKPQIDFTWKYPCRDIVSGQSQTEFIAEEKSTPTLTIGTYEWDFNVANSLLPPAGNGAIANPIVNYTNNGTDFAELIFTTDKLCRDTIQKQISILPTYQTVTALNAYEQNFNSGADGWIFGGKSPSWGLGATMAGSQSSDGAAWATGVGAGVPNNNGENSWVMSGCFDLSEVSKPIISLDLWSDTPSGVDGAVLQYNIDGDISNTSSWDVLGVQNQGINWYNAAGIANSPGDQSSGDIGWTGNIAPWTNAIFKLDDVPTPTDTRVIFRIAFAGGNSQRDGFAFDDVFIGERSRIVLLENFTNSSISASASTDHNDFYRTFQNATDTEIVKVQYHTAFPGNDPINGLNKQIHNSRTAFYGITQSPSVRLDGDFGSSSLSSWLPLAYDRRVLTPSSIDLSAISTLSGDSVLVDVTIKNTTGQTLPLSGAHVFVVIVKKSIIKDITNAALFGNSGNSEFVYVAQQMLPTPAGIPIGRDLLGSGAPSNGDTYTTQVSWKGLDDGDAIVVFVQNIQGDDKTVHQALLLPSPPTPTIITSTEDPEYAKHITLYPNPANTEVHIELPAAVNKPTPVTMVDTYGRTVFEAMVKVGEKGKTIPTTALAEGMYLMQIMLPQGGTTVRKVMVKH